MKEWIVDYSVKYHDGVEEERSMSLGAANLMDAFENAQIRVQWMLDNEEIEDAVIWSVGIVDDDVWPEE